MREMILILALFMNWNFPDGYFAFEVEEEKAAFELNVKEAKLSYPTQVTAPLSLEDYFVDKPRIFEKGLPSGKMSAKKLAAYIKNHKVVFYTGAGISAAAGIPTMQELENLFRLDLPRSDWVEWMTSSPEEVLKSAVGFSAACERNLPTGAHQSLAKICQKKSIALWTENLDKLHQKAGVEPFVISAAALKQKVTKEELSSIDAIVCIGMSGDDKGLLGWYKNHNPEGKIISIDLAAPTYLGHGDILVQGDLQKIVPEIQRRLRL